MSNYKKDSRSGGGSFKKKNFGTSGKDFDKTMFKVVCANCEKNCEVPFKPNGKKPVLCSDCFQHEKIQEKRSEAGKPTYENKYQKKYESRSPAPDQGQYKYQFEALNAKLDKILKILNQEG